MYTWEYRLAKMLIFLLGFKNGLKIYNLFSSDTQYVLERGVQAVYTGPVKTPAFYDISHWKIVTDWEEIFPHPILMGTKATQGTSYRDPTFIEYFTNIKNIVKCRRLAYHYFEKTMNPVSQADWFISYVGPYITDDDILCLDFEQGGETASMLWAWMDRVHTLKPNNLIIIYSRKNLADPIVMNSSEKEFFKSYPFWTAGYPTDPSQYTTTPTMYIPDQAKWGPVWAWQYTDQGPVEGIENGCDCNLVEPDFVQWLGAGEIPSEDVTTNPYIGVTRITGRRFDSDIYVTMLDTTKVLFHVMHEIPFDNGLFYPSNACKARSAQFAWNGDEWDKSVPLPAFPKNLAVSDGDIYVSRKSAEPSLNIRKDGSAEIIHSNNSYHYNTSTGRRYLIENGVIKDYLYGTEPQYTEIHPRGLTGLTQDKKTVIMVTVDGRSSVSAGVTLLQGAQILKEFGAYTAFDRGGGGDAVDVMGGEVQNVPCDTGTDGQPGIERAVPQAILVYAEKESDQMAGRFVATALSDGTRIRLDHNTGSAYKNSYPKGTVFVGDDAVDDANTIDGLFTATEVLRNASGQIYQQIGDKWLCVKTVNGQPPTNMDTNQPMTNKVWVAVIHMGGAICTLVDNGGTPPEPPVDPVQIQVTVELDGYSPVTMTGEATPL